MGQVPSEERRQKYYSVLAGEAHRLQRLVEGLLHFGRMEAGAQEYRMEQVETGELVRRAVEEVEPGGGRIDVSDSEAARVNGDLEALTAAVRNLLDNALKYSHMDSRVEAGWRRGDGQVFIFVRDQGAGIPAEEQKAVFEKFVRGRRAVADSIKGTGVGLAMVKHIMTAHGGEVRLESKPGQGCTFTLVLPAGG
jgi:signal transduction histidine kinase